VCCSGNQPTKVSSANLSLFLPTGFYQQQDSQEMGCTNILTAANLTGTISAAVLGNSTFLLVPQQLL
jgi:hypothetical protein